jgi:subtilisin family serine protease
MAHDRASWRMKTRRAALALIAVALPLAGLDFSAVQAQNFVRGPNVNVGARIPAITPAVTPRINPNIASGVTAVGRTTPNLRTQPSCSYAHRDSDGECSNSNKPVSSSSSASTDGGGGLSGKSKNKGKNGGAGGNVLLTGLKAQAIFGELVAEIDSSLSSAQADELARRHRLERIESQTFPLVGGSIGLFRIIDRRPVETVRRELAADASVRSVQLNFRYFLQQQKAAPTEGDAAQYAVAKLRLPQAHLLATGANVTIAVIDSGIDARHPELANSIADNFDALGSKEGPHVHGTGIAGAIVAHGRLMGSAPAARILAIRAFGAAPSGAESTSFLILKGLNYAVEHGAQIINMSFAGPKDPVIERGIAATAARGVLMIAASGNAGPKSPPLYPAANPNVIAVSATDAQDRLFTAANRGVHIAISAPGVDLFLPAPDEKYQMTSGTSFSAAYVSGLVALMLERNPALRAEEVRTILAKTARDLGAPGRDDLFGAGEADAFAAVTAAGNAPGLPVAAVSGAPAGEKVSDRQQVPPTRELNEPAAAMASGKPPAGGPYRPAAR